MELVNQYWYMLSFVFGFMCAVAFVIGFNSHA